MPSAAEGFAAEVREQAQRVAQLQPPDAEQLHLLLDREERNAEVITLLKERLEQQNADMQKLVAENMAISEHLQTVQASLEKMKALAADRGIGQEVGKLVKDSGLNAYLCRKVFRRLYDDALKRVERRRQRAMKLLAEKEVNLAKTFAGQIEFTDTDCAFLRIRPLVPVGSPRSATAPGGLGVRRALA
ncbi:unnamed protein product [Amoebophrya sp. A120]|nr:unnamed protein product [Amoebophrya sp. A120]|eukprot:GSA120T00021490001.1